MTKMRTVAIITAAGYGKRMGRPKQFLEIGGKAILERTLSVFESAKVIDSVILVVNSEDVEQGKAFGFRKLDQVVAGGKERQDSVLNGLRALPADVQLVVVHDGARPFITVAMIEQAVAEAEKFGAVVVGVPLVDTIKKVESRELKVESSLDRRELWAAQTPQVFRKDIILKAYEEWAGKLRVTDDAMLVEKMGVPVKMALGSYRNIKITTPEDLRLAEAMLKGGE